MQDKTYLDMGSPASDISDTQAEKFFIPVLDAALADSGAGQGGNVLLIPPDITRFHSRAGLFTCIACR